MKIKVRSYKSFLNGRYLSEGVRITAGIIMPSVVMNQFNMLAAGLVMSVGALCVSITDSPGPVRHRRNAMAICISVITMLSVLVYYASASVLFLGLVIFLSGFIFSMLTVYGNRTSSIGIAALIVMILSMESPLYGMDIWKNAAYIFAGGSWFMLYSLLLYRLRPYKIIQQVLGDFIMGIATYLHTRSLFYANDPDYDKTYRSLLDQQIHIESQQHMLSELLFKTRTIVKESTHTSRVLLKIYLQVADLFESVMTTYQQYHILHQHFDETGIMEQFREVIELLANELQETGVAVKSGTRSVGQNKVAEQLKRTREHFEALRLSYMTGDKVDDFISLGRILYNLEDMEQSIRELHHFTSYDRGIRRHEKASEVLDSYKGSEDIRFSIFFNNLNFSSNIFRHSLRVSLALLAGFIISILFHTGHSYWILLTIVVILKPAYSLTKTRNKDRLTGTIIGLLIGLPVLYFVHNNTVLFMIMIFFMGASYTFLRTNYFLAVILMTPELLILFHLLSPGSVLVVFKDRLIDTVIGSSIAFFTSLFIVPAWEHSTIKSNMVSMLHSVEKYYLLIAYGFARPVQPDINAIRNSRREILVSLANLSDAFTRMLSEPKRYQKGIEHIHRFVVLNHTLTSHLATLSYYLNEGSNPYRSAELIPVIENTRLHFTNAVNFLENNGEAVIKPNKGPLKMLNEYASNLLDQRKREIDKGMLETETKKLLVETKSVIDQFNYVYSIAGSLSKSCKEINLT